MVQVRSGAGGLAAILGGTAGTGGAGGEAEIGGGSGVTGGTVSLVGGSGATGPVAQSSFKEDPAPTGGDVVASSAGAAEMLRVLGAVYGILVSAPIQGQTGTSDSLRSRRY